MTDLTIIFGPQGFTPTEEGAQTLPIPEPGRGSLAEYAQLYASMGWPVLPVFEAIGGRCSCGRADCRSPGKHPRVKRGVNEATTDRARIAQWWHDWPDASIGVAMGQASGLWALDMDPRNGGEPTLAELSDRVGGLPDTALQLTGGGGLHYLFQLPPDMDIKGAANKLGPGLDVKGSGGFILVEPSSHVSGHHYAWEGSSDPLEGHPVLRCQALEHQIQITAAQPMLPAEGDIALPAAKVAEIRSALTCIPADDRDLWLQVGMALHSTQAGQQAFGLWCEWSQSSPKYDAGDQRRVWDSMKRDHGGVTLSSLFGHAKARGWTEAGGSWTGGLPVQPTLEAVPATGFEFIPAADLIANPQPPEWVITDVIEASTLGVVYGDSDAYKSFIALDMGLHVAAGRTWYGKRVRQGSVFYVAGEGHRGIGRRVAAWCKWHQVSGEIPFYASRTSAELTSYHSAQAVSDAVAAMADNADTAPGLVIIDTLAANFGAADENSAKDMGLFLTLVQRLLRERFDCTVLVVHHVGHGDKKRERGSYALRGNVDTRLLIERTDDLASLMTCEKSKDAERFKPLAVRLQLVPLGFDDHEGRPVTSLAVAEVGDDVKGVRTTAIPPPPPSRKARGTNQQIVLGELARLLDEHAERLGGVGVPRVEARELRVAVEGFGVTRSRFYEVMKSLTEADLVESQPPHVALTDAGRAALEREMT